MSAIGTEAPSTWGDKHWTHRRSDLLPRGERHHSAKLSEDAVRWMRKQYAQGVSVTSVAKQLRVSRKAARYAILGVTWKHVRGER